MKKHLLITMTLIFAAACNAPQRTKAPTNWVNGNSLNESGNFINTGTTAGTSSGTTTGTTSGTNSGTTGGTTEAGFESCSLSDKYNTVDIGQFGLCQSTLDETSFKLRTSLSSQSVRVCLIPTYKEGSGSSTYIGNPMCTLTTSNQTVMGKLYKDRQGFSGYSLNGVIVMKEPLLPEYFACMKAYVSWPANVCPSSSSNSYCAYWMPRCPYGGRSSAMCDVEGKNYMASICNSFKAKYSNSYIDIRTKN